MWKKPKDIALSTSIIHNYNLFIPKTINIKLRNCGISTSSRLLPQPPNEISRSLFPFLFFANDPIYWRPHLGSRPINAVIKKN